MPMTEKAAVRMLAGNQERFEYLINFSPTVIYCVVPSGDFRITYISNNLYDILGYLPEETYQDPDFWHDHIHPDDRPAVFSNLAQLFTKEWHIVEYRFRHKEGHYLWMHDQMRLLRDADGELSDVVGSLTDITERKNAERKIAEYSSHMQELVEERTRELVVARDEALAAERAMSTFLSNMSHELRTPLHGILSFARFGTNKLERVSLEKLGQYFTEIYDSGDQLLGLVNNLLDLSKLRAGKMVYDFQVTDMDELIKAVLQELRKLFNERGISIDYSCRTLSSTAMIDKVKMAQVIRNLVSNAIKFSPCDSTISIEVSCAADGTLQTQISDQGVGIPEGEFELIFDAFSQSSKTRTNAGGTGLGLPICKEIIENGHHGTISACNSAQGGACFSFVIPGPGSASCA